MIAALPRATACLEKPENLEMSGILTSVREVSGGKISPKSPKSGQKLEMGTLGGHRLFGKAGNLEMSGILTPVGEMLGKCQGEKSYEKVAKNWKWGQGDCVTLPYFILMLQQMAMALCFCHYKVFVKLIVSSLTLTLVVQA